jgi:hypothetical protein
MFPPNPVPIMAGIADAWAGHLAALTASRYVQANRFD